MSRWLLALLAVAGAAVAAAAPRIEARSVHFLAVGVAQGERLVIHVSKLEDNAPLRDGVVSVTLRGAAHPTTAEADGSYSLTAKELALPGATAVEFLIAEGELHETLKGTLEIAKPAAEGGPEGGNLRQYGWWVLNFGVCIAFLWLFSRRKKTAD